MRRTPALLLVSLVLARPASTRAQDPSPTPPEPPTAESHVLPIIGFVLDGKQIDRPERIEALLGGVIPPGARFVDEGPADRVGTPIATIPRLREALGKIGYDAIIEARSEPAGVRMHIHLRPFDRIRHIFVDGNGFAIRQDEIQRRIAFRPGQPLPLPGPERDEAIERERARIIEFLRGEGYMEANARIELRPHGLFESVPGLRRLEKTEVEPAALDLYVTVTLGPGYPIGAIRTIGNHAVPSEEIADVFRHRKWLPFSFGLFPAPFNQKRMREDLGIVTQRYRDEGYPGARVSTDFESNTTIDRNAKKVPLGVIVTERKRISVTFEGSRRSPGTLLDRVTMFQRGAFDDYEASASADSIHHYFQERGHFLARVQWRRERISPDADRIVFVIDEGPELRVRSVRFAGNSALSSEELAEVVTVRRFPFIGHVGLGTGGYVTGRQIGLDVERLVQNYRAHGYPDAQARGTAATSADALGLVGAVAGAAETVSRDTRDMHVLFTVQEGPRVTVGSVQFRSVDGTPLPRDDAYLHRSLRIRVGDPLRPTLIREDGNRLKRLLGDDGHPAAEVEPDVERSGNSVALIWKIRSGVKTRIGPVFIRGNFLTRADTILEQIPLEAGGLLTTTGFERGQRNLQLLQLFNRTRITFPGQEEGRAEVPMVIEVEERHDHAGTIRVGAGASTEQAPPDSSIPVGIYGSLGYEHRNLFGRGWILTSRGDYGNSLARANVLFQDRRFFGTFFRLELGGNYLSQATVRLGDIRQWGGTIGFAREMYPGVDAAFRYNLRNTTRTEFLLRSAGPDERQSSVELGTTVGSLSLSVEWLRLDNRLLPTRGFKLDGFAELALPALSFQIGQDTFLKVGARSTVVMPVHRWVSVRHGARFDQGFPLAGAHLLPKVERFFAGGDTTLRGFETDRARAEIVRSPLGPGIDSVEFRPLGGSLRILHNIDLQFPVAPPLWMSVFLDSGVVADSLDGLHPSHFRHGIGFSPLLIKLPIGDISLSWAWPIDLQPGDARIGRIHVNIGLMF